MRTLLGLLLLSFGALACADRALLIGIGQYLHLPSKSQLEGPPGDAIRMDKILELQGFEDRRLLLDEQAKLEVIKEAIEESVSLVKSGERYVFYFAGHGTNKPKYGLLPHDVTKSNRELLTSEWLHEKMMAIRQKGASVTVILDACFAGGFAKGSEDRIQERYYAPDDLGSDLGSKGPERVTGSDRPVPVNDVAASPICYVTAAKANEKAIEILLDGEDRKRGLFTMCFADELERLSRETGIPWEQLIMKVRKEVQTILEPFDKIQNPSVSPKFGNQAALRLEKAPSPPTIPSKMLELFNLDRADPEKLELTLEPDSSLLHVGQRFWVNVKVNKPGFLLVMSQRGSKFNRLYPPDDEVVQSDAGDVASQSVSGTAPQDDTIRAFLFRTKAELQAALAVLPYKTEFTLDQLGSKDVVAIDPSGFSTASASITFNTDLVGGATPTDRAAFWALLRSNSAVGKAFVDSLQQSRVTAPVYAQIAADQPLQNETSYAFLMNHILTDEWLPKRLRDAGAAASGKLVKDSEVVANNLALIAQFAPNLLRRNG